jgi:hypothetical protein
MHVDSFLFMEFVDGKGIRFRANIVFAVGIRVVSEYIGVLGTAMAITFL